MATVDLEPRPSGVDVAGTIPEPASPWARRLAWLVGIVAAVLVGLRLADGFPDGLALNLTDAFESFGDWVIRNDDTNWLFVYLLVPLKEAVNATFDGLVQMLERMTWLGVVVAAVAVAGLAAGWRMAILAGTGFTLLGALGLWEPSLETLALVLVAVSATLVVGIPVGIWAGRNDRVERALRPILDAMQTIPAFSYLLPLVLLFSIGTTTAMIATAIFSLPPAIRLTSLGIRGVPPATIEVARSYGSTPRQILTKVQLPLAMRSIMLGVNQTIMMALGMVVIAAAVGFQGLGREVYNALQSLRVGDAFNAGVGIVILAIVLDRVTYAWGHRDRRRADSGEAIAVLGLRVTRPAQWAVAAGVVGLAVLAGREVLRQQLFPEGWTVSLAGPTDRVVDSVTSGFGGLTPTLSDVMIRYALDPIRDVLQGVPWWMVCLGAALLAWRASRRIGLAIGSFALLGAVGVLGVWDIAMDTLSQVIVAVALSVAIAIPLGIWSARSDGFRRAIRPVLDAMQTMPAFVYLVPVIILFNVGRIPGIIAALVYALPPCIRLTDLGIRQVPRETVEAAVAYGSTPTQVLRKVQLPLARPSILLGVNQTIMMVLSVVIIAGLIGGGGLGLEVIKGIAHDELGRGVVGGVSILLLAIVIDRITQAMGMAQRSLRGPVGTGGMWWTRLRAMRVRTDGANGKGAG